MCENRWMGPKVIIISDIMARRWSVHIAMSADDELRLIGHRASHFASKYKFRLSEWNIIYTPSAKLIDDNTYWAGCDIHVLVGIDGYGRTDRARWCIFMHSMKDAVETMRAIARQFEDNGTFTSDDIDDTIAVIMSMEAATHCESTPEPREICAD